VEEKKEQKNVDRPSAHKNVVYKRHRACEICLIFAPQTVETNSRIDLKDLLVDIGAEMSTRSRRHRPSEASPMCDVNTVCLNRTAHEKV
jgi:hypothetical protein